MKRIRPDTTNHIPVPTFHPIRAIEYPPIASHHPNSLERMVGGTFLPFPPRLSHTPFSSLP
jgi:hypothetical protein